jgi:hypothetical protein
MDKKTEKLKVGSILKKEGGESMKKINKYLKDHPLYSATIHLLAGIGVGLLVPDTIVIGNFPNKFGTLFLGLALIGYLYPTSQKK